MKLRSLVIVVTALCVTLIGSSQAVQAMLALDQANPVLLNPPSENGVQSGVIDPNVDNAKGGVVDPNVDVSLIGLLNQIRDKGLLNPPSERGLSVNTEFFQGKQKYKPTKNGVQKNVTIKIVDGANKIVPDAEVNIQKWNPDLNQWDLVYQANEQPAQAKTGNDGFVKFFLPPLVDTHSQAAHTTSPLYFVRVGKQDVNQGYVQVLSQPFGISEEEYVKNKNLTVRLNVLHHAPNAIFTIIDAYGKPVVGAAVSLKRHMQDSSLVYALDRLTSKFAFAQTDANGQVKFLVDGFDASIMKDFIINISKASLTQGLQAASYGTKNPKTLDSIVSVPLKLPYLNAPANAVVRVVDAQGKPLPNALVEVRKVTAQNPSYDSGTAVYNLLHGPVLASDYVDASASPSQGQARFLLRNDFNDLQTIYVARVKETTTGVVIDSVPFKVPSQDEVGKPKIVTIKFATINPSSNVVVKVVDAKNAVVSGAHVNIQKWNFNSNSWEMVYEADAKKLGDNSSNPADGVTSANGKIGFFLPPVPPPPAFPHTTSSLYFVRAWTTDAQQGQVMMLSKPFTLIDNLLGSALQLTVKLNVLHHAPNTIIKVVDANGKIVKNADVEIFHQMSNAPETAYTVKNLANNTLAKGKTGQNGKISFLLAALKDVKSEEYTARVIFNPLNQSANILKSRFYVSDANFDSNYQMVLQLVALNHAPNLKIHVVDANNQAVKDAKVTVWYHEQGLIDGYAVDRRNASPIIGQKTDVKGDVSFLVDLIKNKNTDHYTLEVTKDDQKLGTMTVSKKVPPIEFWDVTVNQTVQFSLLNKKPNATFIARNKETNALLSGVTVRLYTDAEKTKIADNQAVTGLEDAELKTNNVGKVQFLVNPGVYSYDAWYTTAAGFSAITGSALLDEKHDTVTLKFPTPKSEPCPPGGMNVLGVPCKPPVPPCTASSTPSMVGNQNPCTPPKPPCTTGSTTVGTAGMTVLPCTPPPCGTVSSTTSGVASPCTPPPCTASSTPSMVGNQNPCTPPPTIKKTPTRLTLKALGAVNLSTGQSSPLEAKVSYSDSSVSYVTYQCKWAVSGTNIGLVQNSQFVSLSAIGTADVTCAYQEDGKTLTDTIQFNVSLDPSLQPTGGSSGGGAPGLRG